jgi:ABC-type branched-subunit amino acid transport system substrate-binding protein
MSQEKADIVVLELFSPEIEIAARQMKELGLNIPVTSVETIEWSSNPELFEGNWFVSDTIVPEFASKFKSTYGVDPKSGSSYVYDLVSMLIKLQEGKKEPIQHADLPNVIKGMGEWNSPVFGKIKIDNDGFFLTEPSVKMIKDGKVVTAR